MAVRAIRTAYVVHKQGNQPPLAPTGLVILSIDAGTAILDWDTNAEPQVTSYNVYYSTNGIGFSLLTNVASSTATVGGLSPFTNYFKVTAVTATSESGFSDVVSGQDAIAPAIPTGLTILGFTQTTVALDWNNNAELDFAYYRVYQSTNDVSYSLIPGDLTNSVTVVVGLTATTTYYWKVTATDQSGNESARTAAISINVQPATVGGVVSESPESVFFGRSDLDANSYWRITSMPANVTITALPQGDFTIVVGASATPGASSFGWQLSKAGVTSNGSKSFTIT